MQTTALQSTGQYSSEDRLLLREFSHRINNEFAAAIGMISVVGGHLADAKAKAALAAVETQLLNYARVHHALQMPEDNCRIDAAAYLRQLCRAICNSKLNAMGITLLLAERPLQMDSERCWRLGLIVSELITNSARHAFRDNNGVIRVELLPSAAILECRVTDNGTSEPIIRPGNGTRIIESLAQSLGGTVQRHFGPQGTTTVLILPSEHASKEIGMLESENHSPGVTVERLMEPE
jgi:two-component sensor histidine kinase